MATDPYGVAVVYGSPEPRPPCAVCGTPAEKHGSYPTCASHPYTSRVRASDPAQQEYALRRWIATMEMGVARMTSKQRETGEQVLLEMREALRNLGVSEARHQTFAQDTLPTSRKDAP
jgi:hypothetical protein